MDHAIGRFDVGRHHRGIFHLEVFANPHRNWSTFERFQLGYLGQIRLGVFTSHHVIFQDASQLWGVLHQGLHRAGWELSKGLVVGRKYGEGAWTFQGFDQSSHLDGGYEGFKGTGINGNVNNVGHGQGWG